MTSSKAELMAGRTPDRDDTSHHFDPLDVLLEAAQQRASARRLPGLLAGALRLTWRASPRRFIVSAALQVLGALVSSAVLLVGKLALDALVAAGHGASSPATLAKIVMLFALVTAAGSAVATFQQLQETMLGEQVADTAWGEILGVTSQVELAFYESPRFYDQLQRVRASAPAQPAVVTAAVLGLIGSLVRTMALLGVLLAIEPLLVPVLVAAGAPALLLGRRASRAEFRFVERVTQLVRARDYLRAVLTGRDEAKEVRAFGAEQALRSRCDVRTRQFRAQLTDHMKVRRNYALARIAVNTTTLAITLGLLAWLLSVGRLGLASAAAAVMGVRMLNAALGGTFGSIGGLVQAGVFLADLDAFLGLADIPGTMSRGPAPNFRRRVSIESVSYTYPGSSDPVLHDVELHIEPGEVIALVGENGSGKTTLAKLLAGLYAPGSGRITWDDVDISEYEPADVRRSVTVIFQDFVRYQLSALENIGLGDPDNADDEEAARAAARWAGADGFLAALPAGYATTLSKEYAGGRELSQGQWQRVALARALRRESPLVILDEPSAALDPRAEHELFEDMRATLGGRSALLISHRYSSVRSADRIYVMQAGKIVDSGSHQELMERGGLYAELFSLQARAYL